jgi:hypothetical protein
MRQILLDETTQKEVGKVFSTFVQANKSPMVFKGAVYSVVRKYPIYDDEFGDSLVVIVNKAKDQNLFH